METATIIAILCLAALVHGALGFGTGLVAMPLLTLFLGVRDATALVAFVILGTTIVVFAQGWRSLHWRPSMRLSVGAALGVPLGILVLTQAPAEVVQRALGVSLIVIGLYSLAACVSSSCSGMPPRRSDSRHLFVCTSRHSSSV
jgi:uncharacterized membrane protein YfcA